MKILRPLLCGALALASTGFVLADPPATAAPPQPTQSSAPVKPKPSTPAPKEASAQPASGKKEDKTADKATAKKGKEDKDKAKTEVAAAPKPNPALPGAPATPAPAPAAPKQGATVLDNYLQDLNDALKLTAEQKKKIESYYVADAAPLKAILDDPASSPLQQEQQAADLRNARNTKIEALFADVQQKHDFYAVEANYRVELLKAAANGTLNAAPVPGGSGGSAAPTQTPAAANAGGPAQ